MVLVTKSTYLEQRFHYVESEIFNIKKDLDHFNGRLYTSEGNFQGLARQVSNLEHFENYDLQERVIDIQARSIRDNLIFWGVDETPEEQVKGADNIHTEQQLKRFIKEVMKIEENTNSCRS